MKKTVGENLRIFRMRSGLSMEAAGKEVGVSAPAILKYERNQIIATLDRLESFAKLYNVSVEEILDVDSTFEIKFDNFKCKGTISDAKKQVVKDLIRSKIEAYFNVLELSDITFQNKFGVHIVSSLSEAEILATKLRIFFTIPVNNPISNLVYLLENNGMMIITIPKNEKTEDFIGFYEIINGAPVIVVLEEDNGYQQRFSIAKYLGELLIVNKTKKDILTTEFALSLLMPREAMISEFDDKRVKIEFKEIEIFSNNYKVNYKSVVNRLKYYEIITPSNAKYLNIHINKNNIRETAYYEEPYVYAKLEAKLDAKGIINKKN